MEDSYSKWLQAEVWYLPDSSDQWLEGIVVDVHEFNGIWKFTLRPCGNHTGLVTLWPQYCQNSTRKYSSSHVEFTTLKRRNLREACQTDDLTKVRFISQPEVERILAERYMMKQFYTELGPVLMYLNYWGDLDECNAADSNCFATPTLQDVFDAGQRDVIHKIPPHPYKLAEVVYRAMNLNEMNAMRHENQTIILTGESGSGKSRNLHYLLEYFTYSSSRIAQEAGVLFAYDNEIEDLILAANTITTSFGCAHTREGNPSSSRFGKYIELYYSEMGFLEGSALRTFLLESDRVVHQNPHQRNFNVFQEISAGLDGYEKADYGFHLSPEFHYLSTEYTSVQGLALEQERHLRHYRQLRQAMTKVGMSTLRQNEAIKVLVGILHMGNIAFEAAEKTGSASDCTSSEEDDDKPRTRSSEGEKMTFTENSRGHVEFACKILGFSVADLIGAITTKASKVAGKTSIALNDEATCIKVRDTLAKTLYHSLFKWIVVEINRSLSENLGDYSAAHVGILDLFGFDCAERNDFNQMCQNYANEILHCHYCSIILDGQLKIFDENTEQWVVNTETAANVESSKHIDIFESSFCGIFPTLNAVMHSSNPCEEQFMAKLTKSNFGNPLLRIDDESSCLFTIRHYAQNVTYHVENIIEMNQGLREINFATLSTSNSGQEHRFSTDNTGNSRRLSSESSALSPSRSNGKRRLSLRCQEGGGSPGSIGSKTPPRSDKNKYKKVKTSVHKKQPIAQTFMTEINELLSQIRKTRSHFLQCFRCCYDYNPGHYEHKLVAQQLRYSACLKSIEAIQNDMSLSMPYSAFITEYRCLLYMLGRSPLSYGVCNALQILRSKPKSAKALKFAVMCLVEIIPIVGAILGDIERNPFYVLSDQHCYDGIEFLKTSLKFSAEYLEYVVSLKRSTIHIIATRLQRIWKAHRFMQFKRYAQARGQHSLVYMANSKCNKAKRQHINAVSIQRRVRVFLAMSWKKRKIAEIAELVMLNMAAIRIQAFVRCEMARKNYERRRTQALAYAKLMTILGCDGEDMNGELALFHYQMDILRAEGQV